MIGRNIDVLAVFVIALAMLGFAQLRSAHWVEGLDSVRFENAIQVQRCPSFREVLSNLSCILHD